MVTGEDNIHQPLQNLPSPEYPLLQLQLYVPGPVSVHVANLWQLSFAVPQIIGSDKHKG